MLVLPLIMAKKAGLEPHLTIMIGYPWETLTSAQKTLEEARRLFKEGLADSMQATIVIPYPGTPLFKQCEEQGWLTTKDWNKYDMRSTCHEIAYYSKRTTTISKIPF